MQVSFSADELIAWVKPSGRRGDFVAKVTGIASLEEAQTGDLSFLGNSKYRQAVAQSRASILLLPADYDGEPGPGQLYLLCDNPSAALGMVCSRIEQQLWPKPVSGVHSSAVIDDSAKVDPSATIGPLCVIEAGAVIGPDSHLQARNFVGRNASIGEDCWLMPGVVLGAECRLANRVRLHSGVVIGSDGFGYEFVQGRHQKVPQIGIVEVGDDVEIGANSTIDRARFSRTVIGEGTKIDNLVQVAHNVVIGKHCILCAQVGVAGSTVLEDYVVLGGQAGVAGHLRIGKGVKAGGQAGITTDIEPGQFVIGYPAAPYMNERRLQVLHRRLPELFKRVDALETRH
jgi:UDP-3-O-[3-hydroxymyristoyl] glucosamine N-acyltransferase